jgi:hypothetical protein
MYSAGRFAALEGSTARFALPNEVHRQKCEQKRDEVEAALSAQLGTALTLQLTVDESVGAEPSERRRGTVDRATAAPPTDDDFDLGGTDVHDLPDAPDATTGGVDAVIEAFPGSEFVE